MKNFTHPSLFRVVDLLVSLTNPGLRRSAWTHDGVDFCRERHTFNGPSHGLAIDIFRLAHSGRRGWSLMVVKEYWWSGEESNPLKSIRWARPIGGQRNDILAWLREQEPKLEAASRATRPERCDRELASATFGARNER
jgi:hypothetical protein